MEEEILVSVVCITYNHANYIMDALNSFLSQKTNFKYEIVIHDDASTDKTVEIIHGYEIMHRNLVHAIYEKENQQSKTKNSLFMRDVYSICKGKYIALCEGDDFWLDSHKLQIQVDFLEGHPEYILSVHNAIRLNCEDGTIETINPYDEGKTLSPEEIIMQYHGNVPTASMVMRADVLKGMEDLFFLYDVGDWLLQLCCITRGKVYYTDRIMSAYRFKHKDSWIMTQTEDFQKHIVHVFNMIDFLQKYNKFTQSVFDKYIIARIQRYISEILYMKKEKGEMENIILSNEKYRFYLEEFDRVYSQTFDTDYYDVKLEKYVLRHKHIAIFGAGDYACRLAKQLDKHHVLYDGFLVSDWKGDGRMYLNKPIWHLSKIPFRKEETGIIIAINPIIWNQIVDSLEKYGVADYICPFCFRYEN